ncbi:MAG: hypothetical protein GF317_20365 [Candidatus Lokiarchaeota archaeon]|nr:hypothetical protein [Candidatus Lokiarchaeota archaeon]MBD3201841.1 hypothetical protein [Candidatus Lokiarchaeota archaeon]
MVILAIDLGTQSIKVAFVEANGKIESIIQESQKVHNPQPGWAEQEPKLWWSLTQKAIKKLVNSFKRDISEIQAISVCGQMHGPVGISENGEITTNWTQIWCDKRSEIVCEEIKNEYDIFELSKITGNPPTTGWPGIKVRWIKEYTPEIYNKTKWFLVPKDFINYKLTGIAATDPSEASGTFLYDINSEGYSDELAEILKIDVSKFANIHKSYEVIGTLKDAIADSLGLPKNIPVLAGGGDFIVSLLGIGLAGEGSAVDMTGTSTLFVVHKEKPIIHPLVQNLKHVIDGWVPFTILDCGGLSLSWMRDFLDSVSENEVSYENMINMAKKIPPGSEGLLFYPYLLGERREENIFSRGCFFGLDLNHKAPHFARAVMEGVGLAVGKDVQVFRNLGVKIDKVYCQGGATRNRLLYQIKANILQVPQIISNEPETTLSGVGILAGYGLGIIDDLQDLPKFNTENQEVIKPNPELVTNYRDLQKEFNRTYEHMIGFFNER